MAGEDRLDEMLNASYDAGRAGERARIVAWLRDPGAVPAWLQQKWYQWPNDPLNWLADRIAADAETPQAAVPGASGGHLAATE